MGDWRESTWGDEISLEYGKAIRGYQNAVAPYRVFGTNGPVGWTDVPLAPGPGVILGRKGAYRGVHYSPDPFFVIDTAYYVKPKAKDLDMRWLYYAIIDHKLGEIDDGSPIPSTTRAAVYVRDIMVPPLGIQRESASLLGALDDKIELNRQTNETLEALARAIFKDWFVDYGPTRAKAEGRPPYLAPELWELFPDALDDEDKPEGWESCELQSIVELNPREPLKKGAEAPYIDMAALPTSGSLSDPAVARAFSSGMRFRNGDTLLARITPCLENGKTAFVQSLPENRVGWGSTEFIVLRARSHIPNPWTYLLARDGVFRTHAIQSMTGTSGRQRARTEALAAYPTINPNVQIWEAFGDLIGPIFDRIKATGEESNTLAQTRDFLLPKLMSGEIRLQDAERIVGEVI